MAGSQILHLSSSSSQAQQKESGAGVEAELSPRHFDMYTAIPRGGLTLLFIVSTPLKDWCKEKVTKKERITNYLTKNINGQ